MVLLKHTFMLLAFGITRKYIMLCKPPRLCYMTTAILANEYNVLLENQWKQTVFIALLTTAS